ncbi:MULTISPECIES: hypothetical protein [unclassified Sphingomonas]|uniref:phage fiber-tail adaptor protein n=1 Tax=unclassified Sphingomonas TaxID=196159 RepID=UPI00226A12D5|nr:MULTISPECIES: hypothetical protein [unclassified Sphingomonas]
MARPWIPADATSAQLVGWFTIDDAGTLSLISGAIDRWNAKVGGTYAQAETAAQRLTYNASSTINGKPEARNTGTQRLKISSDATFPSGSAAFTMAAVAAPTSGNDQGVSFGWGDDYSACHQIQFKNDRIIGNFAGTEIHSEFATLDRYRVAIAVGAGAAAGQPQIVTMKNVGIAEKSATVTISANTAQQCNLFARPKFNDRNLVGAAREFVIYAGALSVADVQNLQGYLAWGAGVQGDLAADHPSKSGPPMVAGGPTLSAGTGAMAISGKPAALLHGFTMPADAGRLAIAGRDVALRDGRRLVVEKGALVLAGVPVILRPSRVLGAGAGSFSFAGGGSQAIYARRLAADAGSLHLVGTDASFTKIGKRSWMAETGQLILAGQGTELVTRRRLVADGAALALTSSPVTLRAHRRFRLEAEAFAIAGSEIGAVGRQLHAEAGTLAIIAAPIALRVHRRLVARPGRFALTPQSATLSCAGVPVVVAPFNYFVVPAQQRAFTVPVRQRHFTICKGTIMSIIKPPAAERRYDADWRQDLAGQEIVGEIEATSTDPLLVVDRIEHKDGVMSFWLKGGTPRGVAAIEFIAPTSGGEHLTWRVAVAS